MTRTLKNIWNIATSILVVLVVLLALALVGVRLAGIQVFTVLSGSMEPQYPVGSLIYVKQVDYKQLEAGDVITFLLAEDLVATHRIVEVVPDENDPNTMLYRTKGDANDTVDGSLVHNKNVIGSPIFTIPKLGYFVDYIQRPPGTYVAIASAAILLALVLLPELFFRSEKDSNTKKSGYQGAHFRKD
ncbi:MAG: signal peptidase I [Coriobacteriia bacterium]|nr:signal peptidase I [Coriobacteriia bacterium]